MRFREAVRDRLMRDTFGGYDWGDPVRLWTVTPPKPERPPLSREEFVAELEWFRDSGTSAALTLEQLGISVDTGERRCLRIGRRDLAAWVRTAQPTTEDLNRSVPDGAERKAA